MKKVCTIILIMISLIFFTCHSAMADKTSSDLLREGLLGAGAGAVGGAASGAKGRDVWKGALAGAGVNIVGGALLDSISGEKVNSTRNVDQSSGPRDAYSDGYNEGFNNGYKQGYMQGMKEGIKEATVN